MWGAIICLVLGAAAVAAALCGRKFHMGLTSRREIPPWQGRLWLMLVGGCALLEGIAGFLSPQQHWLLLGQHTFMYLGRAYEFYAGLVFGVVGIGLALRGTETTTGKRTLEVKLLGLITLFFGIMMIWDVYLRWKLHT